MPQSNEGILLVIGALFLLLGLLGGGFEVSAIKVPPVGKYTRAIAVVLGAIVFGAGLYRLLFAAPPTPTPPAVITTTPVIITTTPVVITTTPVVITVVPTADSATSTAVPTLTPPNPTPTLAPTNPPPTPTAATPEAESTTLPVTANIQDVRVEYDVTRFERKGIVIHIKASVTGLKGIESKATAYFYQQSGEPLKDTNGEFRTVDGNVSASEVFTPGFESTVYDDLQVFMPYDELELGPGDYALKFHVEVYERGSETTLDSSPDVNFDFTK